MWAKAGGIALTSASTAGSYANPKDTLSWPRRPGRSASLADSDRRADEHLLMLDIREPRMPIPNPGEAWRVDFIHTSSSILRALGTRATPATGACLRP